MIVFVLVGLAVLAGLVLTQVYVWRRLVRDTTRGPGPVRRAGTVLMVVLALTTFGALAAERAGAPFLLQQALAWPGFLWLAVGLYLFLALLVGEVVRRVWLRKAGRTEAPATVSAPARDMESVPVAEPVSTGPNSSASEPAAAAGTSASSVPSALADPAAPTAPAAPTGPPSPTDPVVAPAADPEPSGRAPAPDAGRPLAAPSRRLFVSRVVGGAAAAAAVATVGAGTYSVLNGPGVKRVTVPLARLPRAAHGFRIAVVSDIHLGPVLGRGFAERVVHTINGTQPDLIAVVGDLVDGDVKDLGPAAAPLARLRARHGTYFVTGNHEYFSGAEQWITEVRELGMRPLQNARAELPYFDLAGVSDPAGETEGEGPDFARALGDRDRSRASVLLAHQPVVIDDAIRHGVDLQLSGHTHGGQLFPGNLVAGLANPTLAGLEKYGDTQLYVSRGAGAWGPPTRVGAPSDITVIELASLHA